MKRNGVDNKQTMNAEKPSATAAFNIGALVLMMPSASVTSFKTESLSLYWMPLQQVDVNKGIFTGVLIFLTILLMVQILP